MTRQKTCVLAVIRENMGHLTAEDILKLASERLPGISRATVYNNLKALEREGLIRRITAESDSDMYDSSFIPHGHLFCTECGEVADFEIPDFNKMLMDYTDGNMESYELKVRYVCRRCATNPNN